MGLEPVNALGRPAMLERTVQFDCQSLQLHAAREAVRCPGAPPYNPIYLLLNVDERHFHDKARLGYRRAGRKQRDNP